MAEKAGARAPRVHPVFALDPPTGRPQKRVAEPGAITQAVRQPPRVGGIENVNGAIRAASRPEDIRRSRLNRSTGHLASATIPPAVSMRI
jgi:hypothetical protein